MQLPEGAVLDPLNHTGLQDKDPTPRLRSVENPHPFGFAQGRLSRAKDAREMGHPEPGLHQEE